MKLKSIYPVVLLISLLICACSRGRYMGWAYNKVYKQKHFTRYPGSRVRKILQKKDLPYLADIQYIPSGRTTLGSYLYFEPAEKDSALLTSTLPRRESMDSFFLCSHELTNKEYREFVNWVRDSLALSKLATLDSRYYRDKDRKLLDWRKRWILWQFGYYDKWRRRMISDTFAERILMPLKRKEPPWAFYTETFVYSYEANGYRKNIPVYPDTLVFQKEFTFLYNDPLAHDYFWHPGYNEYPVIGISYQQALAYCHWRTGMANARLKAFTNVRVRFRLPKEKEWEYAAYGKQSKNFDNVNDIREFPWESSYAFDKQGHWKANFGTVHDDNKVIVKNSDEDGGYIIVKVNSYKPNGFNLYQMAGNVSEWTSDSAVNEYPYWDWPEIYRHTRVVYRSIAQYDSAIKRFQDHKDSLISVYKQYQKQNIANDMARKIWDTIAFSENIIKILYDNRLILQVSPARIVKGGSWADPFLYLYCATRQAYNEKVQSSKIGFRVAMDVYYDKP
jgi:formylglycine-generating enzyme required for sulfatase activity